MTTTTYTGRMYANSQYQLLCALDEIVQQIDHNTIATDVDIWNRTFKVNSNLYGYEISKVDDIYHIIASKQ